MSFDLNVFDTVSASNQGAELHLLHPVTKLPTYADKEETKPLIISLLGTDSDLYTKEIQKKAKQYRRNTAKNKVDDIDFEKSVRESCEMYAKLTTGFKNIPGDNKKELEFSFDNAFALYMKYKDIRVQVGDFIADQANFIKD